MRRALIVAALLAPAAAAHASSPATELDAARASFRARDCASAAPHLTYVLYPDEKLSYRDDLVDARVMLGACDLEMHEPDQAKKEFEKALQLDPGHRLDPLFFSTDAIREFDDVKAELDARAKRDADERAHRAAADELRRRLEDSEFYKQRNPYLPYVPFGVGQFNNDDFYKGGLFAAGEALTLGTSIGIWFYLVDKYGLRNSNVPRGDAPTVRTLQGIEIGTGIAFVGLAVWGLIDARLHYKAQVKVPDSEKEMLFRDFEKPAEPPKKVKTTMRIVPLVVPGPGAGGAGVGLSWETP